MQDIVFQEIDQVLPSTRETCFCITHVRKKYRHYMYLKTKDDTKKITLFYKNKVHFVDTLSRRTYFWDNAVPCG